MLKKILSFSHSATIRLIAAVLITSVTGVLVIYELSLLADLTDRAFLGKESLTALEPMIILILGIFTSRSLFLSIGDGLASQAANFLKIDLRNALLRKLIALGPNFSKGEQRGDVNVI